jgi:hypothetical protein
LYVYQMVTSSSAFIIALLYTCTWKHTAVTVRISLQQLDHY